MEEQNKKVELTNEELIDKNKKLKFVIILGSVVFAFSCVVAILMMFLIALLRDHELEGQKTNMPNRSAAETREVQLDKNPNGTLSDMDTETAEVDIDGMQVVHDVVMEKTYVDWASELQEDSNYCENHDQCFLAGQIIRGDEKVIGKNMYLGILGGMGISFQHFTVYEENGKKQQFVFDGGKSPIAGIDDIPEKITLDDVDDELVYHEWVNSYFADVVDESDNKIARHETLGKLYRTENGCVVAELPDHTAQAYNMEIPFIDDEGGVPKITFDDGKTNDQMYAFRAHTCVALCNYYRQAPEDIENKIEKVGTASNGDDIYVIKDKNDQMLRDLYDDKNTVAYYGEDWSQRLDENKYSYDEFIEMRPYLYWQDPFGDWIEFSNEKFQVAAEMCKPVVYFYSPEQKNLHVDVHPVGGFTHTDPQHDGGWDIQTLADGRFKDLSSGVEYESLLWEGMALDYAVTENGWIVEKNTLSSFFDEKLTLFNLNQKEINDFKEYWIARLDEKPYYRISFMDRAQFDQLAPMEFSENPDNFIRVMMIAKGVDESYSIAPQILPQKPVRDGFTVVEWGGILER